MVKVARHVGRELQVEHGFNCYLALQPDQGGRSPSGAADQPLEEDDDQIP